MAKRNKGINIFRNVPKANLPRTRFNMNHSVKFDAKFGIAYPFFVQDVIAGDTWSVAAQHFARLAPTIAPVMHDYDVRFHWFFVPTRLVWEDFEDWITGGRLGTWREENPDAFPTFDLKAALRIVHPNVATANQTTSADFNGSIFDYLGLNFGSQSTQTNIPYQQLYDSNWRFSALSIRSIWLIWNYFFRDQNVMEECPVPTTSGADDLTWLYNFTHYAEMSDAYDDKLKGLFSVAWDKDYFTSSTLSPQRGPQVFVPIGGQAPVVGSSTGAPVTVDSVTGQQTTGTLISQTVGGGVGNIKLQTTGGQAEVTLLGKYNEGSLSADLSSSTGAAIDDVREAFALQRFFERMQVVGSRFAEYLRGIFGTNAGDARLQMPEYLGTWQNPVIINNVSNTTGTSDNPQGGYAGNGLSAAFNKPIVKNFPEPGIIVGFYIVMPRNGYQQGLSKHLQRIDWLDWFNPYFEHIGEQPVMTSELFFTPMVDPAQDAIFGYQSQYASYKFINSHSHGEFKDDLSFWHSNRIFTSAPTLSTEFIQFNPEESTERIFALQGEPAFRVLLDMKCYADRPLSAYSTPKMM